MFDFIDLDELLDAAVLAAAIVAGLREAATCAECVKRDGPALPDVCRNCPGWRC